MSSQLKKGDVVRITARTNMFYSLMAEVTKVEEGFAYVRMLDCGYRRIFELGFLMKVPPLEALAAQAR